jgi:hypothetical protein
MDVMMMNDMKYELCITTLQGAKAAIRQLNEIDA